LCERCLQEKKIETAVTVDHRDGNIGNNSDTNLQSLCLSCHNVVEAERGHRF
jgi:hypothetical protein